MQQHRAAWRRSFSWLVLLIFSLLSCMPQTQLNQTPAPVSGAAP
jgi:rhamnogalacturonyl hydrolase YesR